MGKGNLTSSPLLAWQEEEEHGSALLLGKGLKLMKQFEWPEAERPTVAHDYFERSDEELPFIDLAEGVRVGEMGRACREWGFFTVVNHGVNLDLLQGMASQARSFFELGLSEKRRVLRSSLSPLHLSGVTQPLGYTYGGAGTTLNNDFPWMEGLQLPSNPLKLDDYIFKIWNDGNPEFSNVAKEFNKELKHLSIKLLELLTKELGLGDDSISQHVVNGDNSVFRFNFYPPCPQPSMTLGLGAHSDPHILTVLYQDEVGGLQVLKDSKWIGVQPNPNSLIINVGDAFQVWSNGIYKSVEHRAVCNNRKGRLSMAFFLNPGEDTTISPFSQLVNTSHDSLAYYKNFTWREYRQSMYTSRVRGKSNLQHFTLH